MSALGLCVGEWVEVRSEEEILATLDERGQFEGLPFMPQMVQFCGKRVQVAKRVHKLCDTAHNTGARRMKNAVILGELRCDGATYGGCEMDCMILWKESWLKRANGPAVSAPAIVKTETQNPRVIHLRDLTLKNTRCPDRETATSGPIYSCQATQIPYATTLLSVWDFRQYVEDFRSGNATLKQIASVLFFLVYDTIARAGLGFGWIMRWSYNQWQKRHGGWPYPSRVGKLPRNAKTPSANLGLRPGELVRVKTQAEVLETVTEDLVNRGMAFHPEMVPFTDQTFRVSKRVRRLMNEKTGQVMELKNDCLVLEGTPCYGRYTAPLLCPRGMSPYWREIWLERAEDCSHACEPDRRSA